MTITLGNPEVRLRRPRSKGAYEQVGTLATAPTASNLAGLGADFYLDLPGHPRRPGCVYARASAFTALSPTAVQGPTVPPASGDQHVRVTAPGGTSAATSADLISYVTLPDVTAPWPTGRQLRRTPGPLKRISVRSGASATVKLRARADSARGRERYGSSTRPRPHGAGTVRVSTTADRRVTRPVAYLTKNTPAATTVIVRTDSDGPHSDLQQRPEGGQAGVGGRRLLPTWRGPLSGHLRGSECQADQLTRLAPAPRSRSPGKAELPPPECGAVALLVTTGASKAPGTITARRARPRRPRRPPRSTAVCAAPDSRWCPSVRTER